MSNYIPYTTVITDLYKTVSLVEKAIENEERIIDVQINNKKSFTIKIPIWYYPRFWNNKNEFIIWAGRKVYFYNEIEKDFVFDEDIHNIFKLIQNWLIICETSIFLYNFFDSKIDWKYEHDEIIIEANIDNHILRIKDLQNNEKKFDLSTLKLI